MKHVEVLIPEFMKGSLDPDLEIRVRQHLMACDHCQKVWEDVKRVEAVAKLAVGSVPQHSQFLETRIRAAVSGEITSAHQSPIRKWVLTLSTTTLAAVVCMFLFFTPVQQTSSSTIDLASVEQYALANPDLIMAYINSPSSQNSKQIYDALYLYSLENDWGLDDNSLNDHFKFIVSNAEDFI